MTARKSGPLPARRGERLFRENLDLIQAIAVSTAQSAGLGPQDTEDFRQDLLACLMEDDHAVLERFQGRSTLSTFVVAVARRRLIDFRFKSEGRYRPTALARTLGPVAVELERLLVLHRLSRDEAVETLRARLDGRAAAGRLHALAEQLPHRDRRRFVGDRALESLPSPRGDAEEIVRAREARESYRRVLGALREGLDRLAPLQRVVVVLTLIQGHMVSHLARSLGMDQKGLFRLRTRALRRLREHLRERGFGEDVLALFEDLE